GLDIALSTLNSCCCLHEPKTRFPVGRLFPFPGRESHPLKAPGLPWRTEKVSEIRIHDPLRPALYLFPNFAQGVLRRSPSPISKAGIIEYRLEDGLQPMKQRLLTHAIIDRGYAEHAILARFVSLLDGVLSHRLGPIGVLFQLSLQSIQLRTQLR